MPRRKTLRIATFNVNGIGTRLPQLLDWLHRESPDVVALQELKVTDAAFPAAALEEISSDKDIRSVKLATV